VTIPARPPHTSRPPREVRLGGATCAVAGGHAVLAAAGHGSCVPILLRDAGVGGLAHLLIADGSRSRGATSGAKSASTAVPLLVGGMGGPGAHGPLAAMRVGGGGTFAQLIAADWPAIVPSPAAGDRAL